MSWSGANPLALFGVRGKPLEQQRFSLPPYLQKSGRGLPHGKRLRAVGAFGLRKCHRTVMLRAECFWQGNGVVGIRSWRLFCFMGSPPDSGIRRLTIFSRLEPGTPRSALFRGFERFYKKPNSKLDFYWELGFNHAIQSCMLAERLQSVLRTHETLEALAQKK